MKNAQIDILQADENMLVTPRIADKIIVAISDKKALAGEALKVVQQKITK